MSACRRASWLLPVLLLAGCASGARQGTGTTAGATGGRVYFLQDGTTAKLAYSRPGGSEVALLLQCRAGSGTVTLRSAAPARAGASLTLTSGGRRSDLRATAATDGPATLVYADAPVTAPALQGLRATGRLEVRYGQDRYIIADRPEDRADTAKFLKLCAGR